MRAFFTSGRNKVVPKNGSTSTNKDGDERTTLLRPFRVLVPCNGDSECELVQKAQKLLHLCEAFRFAKQTREKQEKEEKQKKKKKNFSVDKESVGFEDLVFGTDVVENMAKVRLASLRLAITEARTLC